MTLVWGGVWWKWVCGGRAAGSGVDLATSGEELGLKTEFESSSHKVLFTFCSSRMPWCGSLLEVEKRCQPVSNCDFFAQSKLFNCLQGSLKNGLQLYRIL
jgi:hypothetical protein